MQIYEGGEQVPMFGADMLCWKMSGDCSLQTEERISKQYSQSSSEWLFRMPQKFLYLRKEDGRNGTYSWETGGASLIGHTMRDFGEFHKEENEYVFSATSGGGRQEKYCLTLESGLAPRKPIKTKLSDILETNPDPKYNLSPKACQGILNRAARRGKELPEMLRAALERQAKAIPSETTTTDGLSGSSPCASTPQPEETDSRTYSGEDNAVVYNEVQVTSPINRSNPKVNDPAPTLNCDSARSICIQGNCIDRADTAGCNGRGWTEDVSYTLNTIDRPAVYDARGNGDGETVHTITGDHQNRVTDYTAVCCGSQSPDIAGALDASYYKGCGARNGEERTVVAVDCRNGTENADINGTLQAKDNGGYNTNSNNICREGSTVRRLTVLECERLQQLPDGWTDIGEWVDSKGKKHKEADAPRYKAIGNGIALPFWRWLLKRISDHCEEKTMGSLFDGVGSYPLIWQSINGDGSCRWTSEIEEFPIAVTTKHFGDEEKGIKGDWEQYVHQGTAAKA